MDTVVIWKNVWQSSIVALIATVPGVNYSEFYFNLGVPHDGEPLGFYAGIFFMAWGVFFMALSFWRKPHDKEPPDGDSDNWRDAA